MGGRKKTNAPRALRTHRGEALLHGTTLIRRKNRPLSRPVTGTKRAARRGRLGSGPRCAGPDRLTPSLSRLAAAAAFLLRHRLFKDAVIVPRTPRLSTENPPVFPICAILPLPFPRRLLY